MPCLTGNMENTGTNNVIDKWNDEPMDERKGRKNGRRERNETKEWFANKIEMETGDGK